MKQIILLSMLLSNSIWAFAGVLEGAYLGQMPRCGVEVSFDSDDALNFQIIDKKGNEDLNETVPLYVLESGIKMGSFTYEKEFFGQSGKVKVSVKGKVLRQQLKSLEIKKVYGLFNFDVARCNDLTRVF